MAAFELEKLAVLLTKLPGPTHQVVWPMCIIHLPSVSLPTTTVCRAVLQAVGNIAHWWIIIATAIKEKQKPTSSLPIAHL